jgi:transcriptional regulator with XRE-family HTH domain
MPLDPAKIIAVMDGKEMSRADLSRKSGIAPPHITRILSGERPDPALSTAERIAKALGCGLKSILS